MRSLRARCAETDPEHGRALAVLREGLREGLREAEHQLAALDAALAGPSLVESVAETAEAIPDARQARDEARRRLHFLLIVLQGVPASCTAAAGILRRGIKMELRKLEQLRTARGSHGYQTD